MEKTKKSLISFKLKFCLGAGILFGLMFWSIQWGVIFFFAFMIDFD